MTSDLTNEFRYIFNKNMIKKIKENIFFFGKAFINYKNVLNFGSKLMENIEHK